MNRTLRVGSVVALALMLALPALAWAHAHLVRSEPSADARLTTPPKGIDLWFSEPVDVAKTTIVLKDSVGAITRTGKTERGTGGRSVHVPVPAVLAPSRYTVMWKTQALNAHPTSGSFVFRVIPQAKR